MNSALVRRVVVEEFTLSLQTVCIGHFQMTKDREVGICHFINGRRREERQKARREAESTIKQQEEEEKTRKEQEKRNRKRN